MTAIPASMDSSRNRRSGIRLAAMPATPSAGSRPPRTTGITSTDSWNASGRHGTPLTTRKLTQFSVPRNVLIRLVVVDVTWALSVYGMIDTPYLPSSSSGTAQDTLASPTAGSHQASSRPGRGLVSTKIAAGTRTAMVDAAFAPLHSATATADCAACLYSGFSQLLAAEARGVGGVVPPGSEPASGTRIHGSIAICRNSPDTWPSRPSAIGDSAYARPAAALLPGVPMSSRPASLLTPLNATIISAASHSRCAIQPSMDSKRRNAKNGPIGNR